MYPTWARVKVSLRLLFFLRQIINSSTNSTTISALHHVSCDSPTTSSKLTSHSPFLPFLLLIVVHSWAGGHYKRGITACRRHDSHPSIPSLLRHAERVQQLPGECSTYRLRWKSLQGVHFSIVDSPVGVWFRGQFCSCYVPVSQCVHLSAKIVAIFCTIQLFFKPAFYHLVKMV